MTSYNTPGIYFNRQETLIQESNIRETAIPAFIGLTQKVGVIKGEDTPNRIYKIHSLSEYESIFGVAQRESFHVAYSQDTELYEFADEPLSNTEEPVSMFFYESIALYFENGGGACYVFSIGNYEDAREYLKVSNFFKAIDLLEEVEEITLLSIPETILLSTFEHYQVQQYALQHCEKMQNRFYLLDVKQELGVEQGSLDKDIQAMRDQVNQSLNYGAAYYPYVRTKKARTYNESDVTVAYQLTAKVLHTQYSDQLVTINNKSVNPYGYLNSVDHEDEKLIPHVVYIRVGENILVDRMGFEVDKKGIRIPGTLPFGIFTDDSRLHYLDYQGFIVNNFASNAASHLKKTLAIQTLSLNAKLSYLADAKWSLASPNIHSKVSAVLAKNYRVLPPSTLIAGMICQTDRSFGVWHAPANIALKEVVEPCVSIDNGEQEWLNVDLITGKSVNAIRKFIGKPPLLWGARTLNGNHDEWRYISVRRLFNQVEAHLKEITQFSIFESNTPFTWLKIKTVAENYLESIWQQGALLGETSEQAFYVNIGLGETMTQQDIYNGIIHVEIGLATVRPAEFILITFTQETAKT